MGATQDKASSAVRRATITKTIRFRMIALL